MQKFVTAIVWCGVALWMSAFPLTAAMAAGASVTPERFQKVEKLLEESSAATRITAAYCARITSHFHETMSMADHAEELGVTPTHLSRVCKESTGKTAADLLTERVLHEARCLLVGTTVPAQDIARHLGFGSAAYFTRFMQHHTKSTPSELRRAGKSHAQAA